MGIRVNVEIEYANKKVNTVALVNTGFEDDVPEILVPLGIAEELGIWPHLPENTVVETYRTASGLTKVYRVPGAKVRLVTEESKRDPIPSYIVIAEQADEVLINDWMISRMKIVIEDPAKGLWKLRGESKIRRSVT